MAKTTIRFPIGKSDFASVRQGQYEYVDKSLFISDVINDSAEVLLFPRPRRFGKTLNLSMLRYFFEKSKEHRKDFFVGLQIEKEKEAWDHFQKYPVIFLTFKDVKASTWEDAFVAISENLSHLYEEHAYLLQDSTLSPQAYKHFHKILNQEASSAESFSALGQLCKYLHDYHQEKVVILIDEYDTCLHQAYSQGYYEKAIEFFRNFLSGGLKDNPHLFRGVVTGILRVAKESIFSGLNNLSVYSILSQRFSSFFGFTETEVETLVKRVSEEARLPQIKAWYNGYLFGKQTMYNPWSILKYLNQPEEGFQAYWAGTADNRILRKLLLEQGLSFKADVEALLQGQRIEKPIEENISFANLAWSSQAIWSFLLFSGYLKANAIFEQNDQTYASLCLVNQEIRRDFVSLTQAWFEKQLSGSMSVEEFFKALLSGQANRVESVLSLLLKVNMSVHDFKQKQKEEEAKTDPESVYHAFVLGVLTNLSAHYEVRSNRESGYGFADVMLIPKQTGKPGVIIEFKVAKKEQNLEKVMQEALAQLAAKQYHTELEQRGASPIFEYAAVFSGKKVKVQLKSAIENKR